MATLTKRKMNIGHHTILMDLAITRFVDQEAREAEAAALVALGQAIYDDWKSEYEPHLPVLTRFVDPREFSELTLYHYSVKNKDDRTFTHGNGQVVSRPASWENKGIGLPLLGVEANRHLMQMRSRGFVAGDCTFSSHWQDREPINEKIKKENRLASWPKGFSFSHMVNAQHLIPLPAPIKVINGQCYAVLYPTKEVATREKMHNSWMTSWITARTYDAYRKLGEAIDTRVKNEAKMLQTIDLLIREAGTYENLLKTWPEAADVEEKLFGPKATSKMLTVVTPEAAGLICKNMQSRGVKSSICEIPAVVTATAAATGNMAAAISA